MEEYMDARTILLAAGIVKELLNLIEHDNTTVRTLVCLALSGLMIESQGREHFLKYNANAMMYNLLDGNSPELKSAACRLITISADERNTIQYIREGVLHYLVEYASLHEWCTEWHIAIKNLLNQHMSAKFAYSKALGFPDITKQDFYCMKRPHARFPEMQEILEDTTFTEFPILLAHFSFDVSSQRSPTDSMSLKYSTTSSATGNINHVHLDKYLKKVKILYDKQEEEHDGLTERKRVQILANFVADQMRGPDPSVPCSSHFVDLHLSELMANLKTNIIPLGMVRAGGRLERALLFKILADRLILPARLVRGTAGYAWIEVTLPQATTSEGQSESDYLRVPWLILKPTHVIDLMEETPVLMPIESSMACVYCGYPTS